MKGLSALLVLCGFLLVGNEAAALDFQKGRLAVGAKIGFGLEWSARNSDLRDVMDQGFLFDVPGANVGDVKNSAGFSAGGWLYADFWLLDMLALEGGIGFSGKGAHWKSTLSFMGQSIDTDLWLKLAYMEIPLGVKLDFMNIRVTAHLLFNIALTGKTKTDVDGTVEDDKWGDADWDTFRRFNLGLRLGAGYAIAIGPIVLIPGVDWSTHFIDEIKDDDIEDYQVRWMDFFFNVAVEYNLPI